MVFFQRGMAMTIRSARPQLSHGAALETAAATGVPRPAGCRADFIL